MVHDSQQAAVGSTHRRRRRVTLRKESRGGGEAGISLLGLTPGTPFMARIADSLAFYACQRLQQGSYQGVAFEVSGSTVPVSHLDITCQRLESHAPGGDCHPRRSCCRGVLDASNNRLQMCWMT